MDIEEVFYFEYCFQRSYIMIPDNIQDGYFIFLEARCNSETRVSILLHVLEFIQQLFSRCFFERTFFLRNKSPIKSLFEQLFDLYVKNVQDYYTFKKISVLTDVSSKFFGVVSD